MRLRILSDLHFEFHADGGKEFVRGLRRDGQDAVVLPGDITRMDVGIYKTLLLFRQHFGCPIIFVHGNHEFYKSNRNAVVRATKEAVSRLQGVYWLDCDEVMIGGRRILGTPLWYGKKRPPDRVLSSEDEWERGIVKLHDPASRGGIYVETWADFESIENLDTWIYDEHGRAIKYLCREIRQGDIVVTHMLPSKRSTPPKFQNALSNHWFVSDMSPVIERSKPALWIHGHTHSSCDYVLGETRVVCNPFGIQSKGELNVSFDEDFTVELPDLV